MYRKIMFEAAKRKKPRINIKTGYQIKYSSENLTAWHNCLLFDINDDGALLRICQVFDICDKIYLGFWNDKENFMEETIACEVRHVNYQFIGVKFEFNNEEEKNYIYNFCGKLDYRFFRDNFEINNIKYINDDIEELEVVD